MHRCLQILEMVEMVCFQFDPYPSRDVKDLASLARTCTIFQGPALDVLWKVQRTLMNLVRCMPTDLFDVQLHAELFGTRKRLVGTFSRLYEPEFIPPRSNSVAPS